MSERVIPLVDHRLKTLPAVLPEKPVAATVHLMDSRQRPLQDLRISVTDR